MVDSLWLPSGVCPVRQTGSDGRLVVVVDVDVVLEAGGAVVDDADAEACVDDETLPDKVLCEVVLVVVGLVGEGKHDGLPESSGQVRYI